MKLNIPGLLGALGELPSVINRGLLGDLPVNSQLGLDPTQVDQARQVALNDMAYGMLAGSQMRNPGLGLAVARQNARENFSGRMVDLLREDELTKRRKAQDAIDSSRSQLAGMLPPEQALLAGAAPDAFYTAAAQSAFTPGADGRTDDIKEYEKAVAQGYTGSFMDYMTGMKKAGATSVNVPVSLGQPNGIPRFLEQRQAAISDQVTKLEDQAERSRAAVNRFDALIAQSKKANLTGMLAPGIMGTGEFLRSFGIDLAPEALADARALDSAINQNHMQWVADLGGARGMTDSENKKLAQALVKIQDSVQARVEVATLLRDAEKRKYDEARSGIQRRARQLQAIANGEMGIEEYGDIPNAAPAPQYIEGQTATNPQTGQTLIFRNGQWVPK